MNTDPWNEPITGFDQCNSDFGSSRNASPPASPVVTLYASAAFFATAAASVARAASVFSPGGAWACAKTLETTNTTMAVRMAEPRLWQGDSLTWGASDRAIPSNQLARLVKAEAR